jgi:hypothetical protein
VLGKLSCGERKNVCSVASVIFFLQESCQTKNFYLRMMQNCQHQHKGKPDTRKKFQGTATSAEDAATVLRGLNLSGAHCRCIHPCPCLSMSLSILMFMYMYTLQVHLLVCAHIHINVCVHDHVHVHVHCMMYH